MKPSALEAGLEALEREDALEGDMHRRLAAHAHVMTHHALELDTPEAHEAAAMAHRKVADMHDDAAKVCEEEDSSYPAKPVKK